MEVGEFNSDTIPEFQFESFDTNLRRCQRYCTLMKVQMLLLRDLLMDFLTLLAIRAR